MTDSELDNGGGHEGPKSDPPEPPSETPTDLVRSSEIPTDLERSYPICGAEKRQGEGVCTRPAGWGTNHAGEGRCKLHGGSNPIKSGRYSNIKRERIRELIAQFEADPNPLDMTSELASCRALYQDYIELGAVVADSVLAQCSAHSLQTPFHS